MNRLTLDQHSFWCRAASVTAAAALMCGVGVALATSPAEAASITHVRTVTDTDFVTAGVDGLGTIGTGIITVSGVSGPVTKTLLFWHGTNQWTPDSVYEASSATVNGQPTVGTPRADTANSCSGPGGSRTYVSDVTALVPGNGSYHIGVQGSVGINTSGATLVVFFDDGNPANNRDVVLLEGDDSNSPQSFPGDDEGWHAVLPDVDMPAAGTARLQLHVASAQGLAYDPLDDGSIVVTGPGGAVTIPDQAGRWDGSTLPDAGHGGRGMDVESFDVTGATAAGANTIHIDHDLAVVCMYLVAALVDVPAGAAPPPPPSCSVSDVAVNEGNAGTSDFVFTVTRTSGAGPASLDYFTTDAAAGGGGASDDYVATSGSVSFAATELSKPVHVQVHGDVDSEVDERFLVNLSNAAGCALADPNGYGTIIDDDTPVAPECGAPGTNRVSVGDAQVFEGDSGVARLLKIPVTLSNPSSSEVSVRIRLFQGSAAYPEDFSSKPEVMKTLKFKPSGAGVMNTTKFVTVKVVPDTVPEGDERFTVELNDPSAGYSIGRRYGAGIILDDDVDGGGVQAVAVAGSTLCEGDASVQGNKVMVQVSLRNPATADLATLLTITNGTATGGTDYKAVPKPKSVKFRAGQVQRTVSVTVFPDANGEISENIVGTITASPIPMFQPTADVVILNDDDI